MNLNKPNPFTPNKNQIGKDWRIWKQGFLIYLKLSGGYENCTEEERAAFLLNLMGSEAVKAMENILFDHPNEKNDMDILIMKFDEIFDPSPNEVLERYKFFSRTKGAKEDIESYVAVLKEKAIKCNFGPQTEKFIIDMIIQNMNKEYQEKMFAIGDIILPDIIQHYKNYVINTEQMEELSKSIMKTFSSTNPEDVVNMNKVKQNRSRNRSRCRTQHVHPFKQCPADSGTGKNEEGKIKPICTKCGTNHPFKQCPADTETGKDEEGKTKPICSKCGTNHPFKQCPADSGTGKNEEGKTKPICWRCGSNHPFRHCPAFDVICLKCDTKGHLTSKCKQKETIKQTSIGNNDSKTEPEALNSTNKEDVEYTSVMIELEDCQWCGSRHVQGKCLHDAICTTCHKFPHNICFKCRKNPHDSKCYYKSIIALPQVVPSHNNRLKPDTPTCLRCGTKHVAAVCPSSRKDKCYRCHNFGHLTEQCLLNRIIPKKENVNPGANTVDPLLQGLGTERNKEKPNTKYFDKASNSTNKQDVEHKSVMTKLDDCQWCGSRHVLGKCLHDANCRTCHKFPHNICFKCGKNPHDSECYYKSIITLPQVVPSLNIYNRLKSDTATCLRCGTKHVAPVCPAPRKDKCYRCNNFGHLTEQCLLNRIIPKKENVNPGANTVDPLLQGLGTERNKEKPNTKYFDKASNSTNKQDVEHKSVMTKLDDCQWCGSRHGLGKCLHDANCRTCHKFPHNICFKCRKNPHDNNCRYKSRTALPQVPSHNTRLKPDIPTCLYDRPASRNDKCYRCKNFGHFTEECPLKTLLRDPVLPDLDPVRNKEKRNTTHFDKGQQKYSNQYTTSSQFGKTNKRSENIDQCTIS